MILAGDIGGTKTVLSLLTKNTNGTIDCVQESSFASTAFASFDALLDSFLTKDISIRTACFGVAGPVVKQRCQTTNLPWLLDAGALQKKLNTTKVKLLNDLEAMALGMLQLSETDLVELNPQARIQTGNSAVIAAGTGLGEAILYWDGNNYHALATEGGHCDFAAQTPIQDELLHYLRHLYGEHISYERIISGIGFSHLYDFLAAKTIAPLCAEVTALDNNPDRNALISQLGVKGADVLCRAVVNLFVELYGAEAGNLALKSLATGGVFIGGGIAPKILPVLQNGLFLKAFSAKGRFTELLSSISVKVSLNPRTPLIGAVSYFS